jgi:hypothetical protein
MDPRNQMLTESVRQKWDAIVNHEALPEIKDNYRKTVTTILLENQENALLTENGVLGTSLGTVGGGSGSTTGIDAFDPILISLVRRSMPNLMAYDIAGVQPMNAPTGLIFAMRSRYTDQGSTSWTGTQRQSGNSNGRGREALFGEVWAKFGGSGGTSDGAAFSATGGVDPTSASTMRAENGSYDLNDFRGMLTSRAEGLGESGNPFQQMAFSIERTAVEAKTRALKAEYTTELAQDLKAVHGLDAESELANLLSTEILHEINREMMYTIYRVAKTGAQQTDLNSAGTYDLNVDSDGRWSAERFRGLMFQIEREANTIAKDTRRGKGNFVICSSDVASALVMGGFLNLTPAVQTQLEVDDTGNTFAGILNGKFKVYIDPYAKLGVDFALVGYRGPSPYDAGVFYCPYVPLQMVRAVNQDTFQPKIGFKTRYGMVANPFAENTDINALGGNQYYRVFKVSNLHGNTGFGL